MSAIFAKKKGSSSGAKLPPIWRTKRTCRFTTKCPPI